MASHTATATEIRRVLREEPLALRCAAAVQQRVRRAAFVHTATTNCCGICTPNSCIRPRMTIAPDYMVLQPTVVAYDITDAMQVHHPGWRAYDATVTHFGYLGATPTGRAGNLARFAAANNFRNNM
jgi:hypothetical protein